MKRLALFFLLSAAFAAQAATAPSTSPLLGGRNCNDPVAIEADKMLADLKAKTVTYDGNVLVKQCDIRMHANSMKVSTNGTNKADKIFADGKVVVDSTASGTVTGDHAVYDVAPRVVTMTGHVVLVHQKDVMRGSVMNVNLVTGLAQLGASKSTGGNGRVQGSFTPTSSPGGN